MNGKPPDLNEITEMEHSNAIRIARLACLLFLHLWPSSTSVKMAPQCTFCSAVFSTEVNVEILVSGSSSTGALVVMSPQGIGGSECLDVIQLL